MNLTWPVRALVLADIEHKLLIVGIIQRWWAMSVHKFKIGETVFLRSRSRNVPGGAYVIIRQLPDRDGEIEYQIKSAREPHGRIVRESQLSGHKVVIREHQSGSVSRCRYFLLQR